MGLVLKDSLKDLCCSNGWSYGVFWCFDQRNSMLLTVEDAYYEEEMGTLVNNMLQQVHIIGEGIVGQAALSGKNQWIFSDAKNGGRTSASSSRSNHIYQDGSDIDCQFYCGLKTIAVIPVESRGVIQFGSTRKIFETPQFLDQAKRLFSEMENVSGIASLNNPPSSLNHEGCDLNEWFASFCNGNITPMQSGSCSELMEVAYSSVNFTQSSAFTSDFQQEKMDPLCLESCHLTNSMQTGTEAQVVLTSNPNTQFEQVALQSAFSSEKSASKTPCISTWGNEGSMLTSLESQFASNMGVQNSLNVFSTKENAPVSCGCIKQDFQWGSSGTSFYSTGGLVKAERETGLQKFPEEFKLDDIVTDLSSCFAMENLFECFATSEHGSSKMAPIMVENVSQSAGVTPVSSSLVGDVTHDIPLAQPSNSMQSSITDSYFCTRQEKTIDTGNDLFVHLGLHYGCEQDANCQENMMKRGTSNGNLAISNGVSECISELDVNSEVGPRKGLFSELGLEELLNGGNNSSYTTNSSIDDQFSTAKSVSHNQAQSGSIACSSGSKITQPSYYKDKASNLLPKKEMFPKSQVGLWIDDSYSINDGSALPTKPKKPEEPTKATRKRARPGESTRPRPKDRQQFQDCIKELKGIIPDGEKCSIDALLDHTIKYMLFLQSVTKYADKLKQADEPKLISKEQKTFPQDTSTSGGGGATWALEVGDQSTACPIIVEDLSPPGLMLIEMLCEDRGFFLEIADVIRGFGLNILKGVMETREDKIWAHFIVEAKTHTTRIEIVWSLVQFLQLTSTGGTD
ncbi:transcription factor bHLH157 [Ricinus communis]|uniref:transcription factor bHLH157 n=1 Tax=Ricinus communis TaxID=3988 RepID=UPI000772AF15|nr:transcription factor bHLH157 [Ricinus communis]|eukprot:XP_015574451.1 transcription factor bHLH157 [Ricinus communis]